MLIDRIAFALTMARITEPEVPAVHLSPEEFMAQYPTLATETWIEDAIASDLAVLRVPMLNATECWCEGCGRTHDEDAAELHRLLHAAETALRHEEAAHEAEVRRAEKINRLYTEGRCRACSRKLTNAESIASGIGPECLSKVVEDYPTDPAADVLDAAEAIVRAAAPDAEDQEWIADVERRIEVLGQVGDVEGIPMLRSFLQPQTEREVLLARRDRLHFRLNFQVPVFGCFEDLEAWRGPIGEDLMDIDRALDALDQEA